MLSGTLLNNDFCFKSCQEHKEPLPHMNRTLLHGSCCSSQKCASIVRIYHILQAQSPMPLWLEVQIHWPWRLIDHSKGVMYDNTIVYLIKISSAPVVPKFPLKMPKPPRLLLIFSAYMIWWDLIGSCLLNKYYLVYQQVHFALTVNMNKIYFRSHIYKLTCIREYSLAVLSSSNGRNPFRRAYSNTPRLQTSAFGPM